MTKKTYTWEGWLDVGPDKEGEKVIFLQENQTPSRHDMKHEEPLFERILDKYDFRGDTVFVRWWSANKKATKQELSDAVARQLLGEADLVYRAHYSDLTGYLWTDNWFKVGNHDLAAELESLKGKYVILEIETDEA